jgi:hypothetical protein
MKNTLGEQFYFFQGRRGDPTRVRPAPQSAIRYMGPSAMSSVGHNSEYRLRWLSGTWEQRARRETKLKVGPGPRL